MIKKNVIKLWAVLQIVIIANAGFVSCSSDDEESDDTAQISVNKEDLLSSAHNYRGWSMSIYASTNYEEIYDYVIVSDKPLVRYFFREDGTFDRVVDEYTSIAWNRAFRDDEQKMMFWSAASEKRDYKVIYGSYFLSGKKIKFSYMGVEETHDIWWKDGFKDCLVIDGDEYVSRQETERSSFY